MLDYLEILLQLILLGTLFPLLGLYLLQWIFPQAVEWPICVAISVGIVLSTLLAGLQNIILPIVTSLENFAAIYLAEAATVVILTYRKKSDWGSCFRISYDRMGNSYIVLGLIFTVFCLALPLSEYPALYSSMLGDWPEYYLAASRIAQGVEWKPDYFSGDYHVSGHFTT